ncbi:DUF992 domain-containing protein [Acuticoccus mangrovi]|uniref:DUF992 domain-containing protein n=1 Tax=Acuticoccus mangrovi TaxID=2796142 RepID=A0A934MN24_9HYPH|nr:DUF992 domain-containing protein [Acuticoccus mangrovi]MBJ3777794.1 DUF992 domain-containing protein [Acuticoccus mangrovi]
MRRSLLALAAMASALMTASPAANASFGIRVGLLTCDVQAGYGLILGSRKVLGCHFKPIGRPSETYDGSITKVGIDAGMTGGSKIVWAVFAPTLQLSPGALEGRYYGVTAEATPGVGIGANVLIGGFDRSINLQPISVQGQVGANIAAGIAGLRLKSPPPPVYKR